MSHATLRQVLDKASHAALLRGLMSEQQRFLVCSQGRSRDCNVLRQAIELIMEDLKCARESNEQQPPASA